MDKAQSIRRLNELYAEEVEAALRYLHFVVTMRGLDRLTMRDPLLRMLDETLAHARVVAEKVLQMGGVPQLDLKVHLPAEKVTGPAAMSEALSFEQAALDGYRELLEDSRDLPEVAEFAREQVALESRHVAELELLVEDD